MAAEVLLRTSERKDFKRCPQRWWWAWREGLRPVGRDADALWFGTMWHMTMAHHYSGPGLKRGKAPIKFWESLVDQEIRTIRSSPYDAATFQEDVYVDAKALGVEMLENYFDTYGKDDTWSVIQPEKTFAVSIPHPLKPGKYLLTYVGTYDLVYRDLETGEIWLGEHKTAKAIQTGHLPLDDQAGSYWATAAASLRAEGLIGPKEKLEGIMYNFVRKTAPDLRPRNEAGQATNKPLKDDYVQAFANAGIQIADRVPTIAVLAEMANKEGIKVLGAVSANQPPKLLQREPVYRIGRERDTQIARIGNEGLHMKAMREGKLPLYKNSNRDCSWDCSFYTMCQLHEQGPEEAEDFKKMAMVVRDPYADHRESSAVGD